MIIIPDLHCQDFWRRAVNQLQNDEKIIFLGDYFDSHDSFLFSHHSEDSFLNIKEILSLKETLGDRCILLIGNHELSYLRPWDISHMASPHDFKNQFKIRKLIKSNLGKFKIAHIEKHNDNLFMFSHAGINPEWFCRLTKIQQSALFESLTIESFKKLSGSLSDDKSCVWDYFEPDRPQNKVLSENCFQIFGHTCFNNPKISDQSAALDTGNPYRLDLETKQIVSL